MSTALTHRVYNDKRWKTIRRATLHRDGYLCQIRLPGCTVRATQADHVTALEDGGQPFDMANTQASCGHCNVAKENNRRLERFQRMPTSRDW